jgi:hypothetical protein
MAKGRTGSGKGKGTTDSLVDAMAQLVGDTKRAVDRPSKRAAKELRKLEKRLVAARAVEIKRLGQLAAATGSKSRREVAKRTRQAGEAAQEVAALAGQIATRAASAAGDAAETVGGKVGGAARRVGTAAAQAAESVSPVKARPIKTPASGAADAKVATPRRRSPVTRPPTTPKPATAPSPRKRRRPTDGSGPNGST